jgi:membrane-bound serine protease (ClpP class)
MQIHPNLFREFRMHAWLGFLAGILIVAAGLLIISASLGVAIGLAWEIAVVLAIILLVIAVIAAWLFYAGMKAQYKSVKTGKEALIGSKGVATSDLKPKGEVRVLGEFWQAIAKMALSLTARLLKCMFGRHVSRGQAN